MNHKLDGSVRMEEIKLREDIPDNCTLCGEAFASKEKRSIFPYPPKHWLCFDCFDKNMKSGLDRLNKQLATGRLDYTVEEISDIIKPQTPKESANK